MISSLLYSAVSKVFYSVTDLIVPSSHMPEQEDAHQRDFHAALRQTLKERRFKGSVVPNHPLDSEIIPRTMPSDCKISLEMDKEVPVEKVSIGPRHRSGC